MHFVNPIAFVRDIEASKHFYAELLGIAIAEDHGDFVRFETGFAIHDGPALERTVWGEAGDSQQRYGHRNLLLYFEAEDVDAVFGRIGSQVALIHPVARQSWGQRVFRFYDPDGHIIEIGEPQDR